MSATIRRWRRWAGVALLALTLLVPGPARAGPLPLDLWLYYSANLWVDENLDRLESVWRRAAKAGYTKVLLADSKFAKLGDMDARYRANLERVKALAKDLGLSIVPAVFPIGYSNSLLWHDPNLAEGLPVKGALFMVKGGEARLVPDPPVAFRESFDWKDDVVSIEGGTATFRPHEGNARFVQRLTVAPFRCYHVSARLRTEGHTGEPRIEVLAGGRSLVFTTLGAKPTQDFTEVHVVFNSLENAEVLVYFGVWGAAKGTVAWKDWRIEEAGPVNLVRREGAPLTVEGLVEGKDFEPVADPRMGTVPWKGGYEVWHEPPPIRTRLPDGTRLRVSWHHAVVIHDGQVCCCLSEPALMDLLRDEARRMRDAFGAEGYMMSHDEIRVLGQDEACRRRGLSAGAILAENARAASALLEGSTVYVWSDMFDPHHNAKKDYYLVRGDLSGSWEGLGKDVVVVNWNFRERGKSLRFFADRGHRQVIAGYYDGPAEQAREWLEAAEGVPGVTGIMYTTWRSSYEDLEAFAKICRP